MDRRSLEYFLAVVDEGNTAAAASAVHVAQPTISVAIRSLEKEVGGALFERNPSGLVPTVAGRSLIAPARQILRDFEVAKDSVRDALGMAGGELEIGTVPSLAMSWLNREIIRFRRTHPQVRVRVHLEHHEELIVERVRSGHYHLGVVNEQLTVAGVSLQRVATQTLVALLPPGTAEANNPITIEELAGLDLITMHRPRSSSHRWLVENLAERGLEPRIGVVVGAPLDVLTMVSAGIGYGLWWQPTVNHLDCVLRPVTPRFERNIHLMHREQVQQPTVLAFLSGIEHGTASAPTKKGST